jgi:hypothetical protein
MEVFRLGTLPLLGLWQAETWVRGCKGGWGTPIIRTDRIGRIDLVNLTPLQIPVVF